MPYPARCARRPHFQPQVAPFNGPQPRHHVKVSATARLPLVVCRVTRPTRKFIPTDHRKLPTHVSIFIFVGVEKTKLDACAAWKRPHAFLLLKGRAQRQE